jgi:hypothetical protein
VRCLLLAGLDLGITNKDGLTAEEMAMNLKYMQIANLLGSLRRVSYTTHLFCFAKFYKFVCFICVYFRYYLVSFLLKFQN